MKNLIILLIPFLFLACENKIKPPVTPPEILEFHLLELELSINRLNAHSWISVDSFTNDLEEGFNYVLTFRVCQSDSYYNYGSIVTSKVKDNQLINYSESSYIFNDTHIKFFEPEHFLFGEIASYKLENDTLTINGIKFVEFLGENPNFRPLALWEVASYTVKAGNNVPFYIRYTSGGANITHLDLWYNVVQIETKKVSSNWVPSFAGVDTETVREIRIAQLISEFPHSSTFWNESIRAFSMNGEFPVSVILTPFFWNPEVFHEGEKSEMKRLFGEGFMETFKEDLREAMLFEDYRRMITELGILNSDEFRQFTDSSLVTGSNNVWFYHFPDDVIENGAVIKVVPPDEIVEIFNNITFAQLVQTPDGFNVSYRREFQINAFMRVYDDNRHRPLATTRTIEISIY